MDKKERLKLLHKKFKLEQLLRSIKNMVIKSGEEVGILKEMKTRTEILINNLEGRIGE